MKFREDSLRGRPVYMKSREDSLRGKFKRACSYIAVDVCIYIYIYRERERNNI